MTPPRFPVTCATPTLPLPRRHFLARSFYFDVCVDCCDWGSTDSEGVRSGSSHCGGRHLACSIKILYSGIGQCTCLIHIHIHVIGISVHVPMDISLICLYTCLYNSHPYVRGTLHMSLHQRHSHVSIRISPYVHAHVHTNARPISIYMPMYTNVYMSIHMSMYRCISSDLPIPHVHATSLRQAAV